MRSTNIRGKIWEKIFQGLKAKPRDVIASANRLAAATS